jgi:hypothetical protein
MTMHASEREDAILKLITRRGFLGFRERDCRLPTAAPSDGRPGGVEIGQMRLLVS